MYARAGKLLSVRNSHSALCECSMQYMQQSFSYGKKPGVRRVPQPRQSRRRGKESAAMSWRKHKRRKAGDMAHEADCEGHPCSWQVSRVRAKLWRTSLEALCLLCIAWSLGKLISRNDRASNAVRLLWDFHTAQLFVAGFKRNKYSNKTIREGANSYGYKLA